MRVAFLFFLASFGSLFAASSDSLVSYWSFDDQLNDLSTAGTTVDNGSWVGTADFNTGIFGNGLELGGSNYVTIPNSTDVSQTGANISISTWFRVGLFNKSWQCLVGKGEGTNWRISRRSSSNEIAYAGGSGDISGGNVNDGQWHHVVAVSEAGVATRLYLDGALIATGSGPSLGSNGEPMMVGNNPDAPTRQWNGRIDDLGIFSSVLNDHHVGAIHSLAQNSEFQYTLGQVNELIVTHDCGPGSSVTVGDTSWDYIASDPADGRLFVQLSTDGSGVAGSTGPGVSSFTVDHPFIPTGDPIVLSWEVGASATAISIDNGIGDVLPLTTNGSGSITLDPGPNSNTTYTLSATNIDGTNSRSVSVEVTPNPIIEFFTASDGIVPPDSEVTLSWSVLNATSLVLNGTDVTGTTSFTYTASSTESFTLTATNANGTTTRNLQITVIIPGEPVISEFSADNIGSLTDEDGDNSDWIEIYNPSASTAILQDYYLTDDPNDLTKWQIPDMNLDQLDHFVVFASGKDRAIAGSELHTNFNLRASGEYLALTKVANGITTILSEFDPYPAQFEGISYGLNPDGTTFGYFSSPTPDGDNPTGLSGFVRDTTFAPDRGFYDAPISVTIASATEDAQIRYTTDGSDPTPGSGTLYTGPITISTTTPLKAIAYKTGFIPTNIDAHTYFFVDDIVNQPEMDSDVVDDPSYSGEIRNDLKSIPTISLSMPDSSLFGGSGIYDNSNSSGVAWERQGSVEFVYPDGRDDKQLMCGVRMQGGVGRRSQFPKHSFRLLFKRQYGDTKLRFPLFQDALEDAEGAVETFDSIILRAGFNNTWHRNVTSEEERAQYLRDQFIHNSQLAMGHASPHGTFFHLYLNGEYWGIYNAVERPNADFGSSYYGGQKEDWDALNSYPRNVVDGTAADWIQAHTIANAGVADQAGYDALSEYVDIPNLIDYMMLNFWGGNLDWDDHNWYSVNPRVDGGGYKFVCWDAERSLENTSGDNKTGVGQDNKPSRLYSQLRANAEFRLQFADRAHHHMFNGGALTPLRTVPRYQSLATYIDRAIVGESARWGDSMRANPYTRDAEWATERDRLLNSYLPQRTDVALSQLRGANLYPGTDAPVFSQHGGHVSSATELTMSNSSGAIYYTTDGTDPRLPGGEINSTATIYDGSVTTTTLVAAGSEWKYLDDGSDQGTAWKESVFDDASWSAGDAQLGYGNGPVTEISFGGVDNQKHFTYYFRRTFEVTDPSDFTALSLELQRDDGAVVYLNGKEVFRSNMDDGTVNFDTPAQNTASGNDETTFYSKAVAISELVTGTNVLAVEVHQITQSSSDVSFDLRLRGTEPNDVSALFLAESGNLLARALDAGEWSALNSAFFFVDTEIADETNLVISELDYRPASASPAEEAEGFTERSDFEFIEITNVSSQNVDLTNVRFTQGVLFNFSDSLTGLILPPGARLLVVNKIEAFMMRYPSVPSSQIAGEFEGSLNNDGEYLELLAQDDGIIQSFTYNDQLPWPLSSDGDGSSLVLVNPSSNPDSQLGGNWRSSVSSPTPGGSDASLFAGSPDADLDGDGAKALLEYAFGSSDQVENDTIYPSSEIISTTNPAGDFFSISYRRNLAADDLEYTVQLSANLEDWSSDANDLVFTNSVNHGDGTSTETYRLVESTDLEILKFARVQVSQR
ncbi:CotH kinase family protein [Akkermansiaceae bacterium]|nr:CotH kinase family protein [Akkermansiaceae bacterium]MDB4504655.1 CotH kinase family protein [Akkermansiaceae bacterium]